MHIPDLKLRIAVALPKAYSPTEGGGFAYLEQIFDTLIVRGIQGYNCIPMLYGESDGNTKTQSYFLPNIRSLGLDLVWVDTSVKRGPLFLRVASRVCSYLGWSRSVHLVRSWIEESIKAQHEAGRKAVDALLLKKGIDLVYYPMPMERIHGIIPFVCTVWDLIHLKATWLPEVASQFDQREAMYHDLLRRCVAVVCESDQGKKEVCMHFALSTLKVHVLPMFAGSIADITVQSDETDKQLLSLKLKKRTFVLYPAQFWPHKNHITLIKSVALLRSSEPFQDLRIVFTGADKGNEAYIRSVAASLLPIDACLFAGFVSAQTLRILYDTCLAMVLPTLYDPTSIPVAEAYALGCPIICSDTEGHRAQSNNTAHYVNPMSVREISDAIRRVFYESPNERNVQVSEHKLRASYTIESALVPLFEQFAGLRTLWAPTSPIS